MKSLEDMAREAARKTMADAARAEGTDAVLLQMVAENLMGPTADECPHRWMHLANGSWCCTLCGCGGGGE